MDLMNMPSVLALGGIAALVATGWQQVKTAINHISSILIVRASFNGELNENIYMTLRSQWKLLPSSVANYSTLWFHVRSRGSYVMIPFKMPHGKSAIFFKGRSFVLYSHENRQLTSIRGFVNLDDLICESVRFSEQIIKSQMENDLKYESRYQIINLMGAEKGLGSLAHLKEPPSHADGPTVGKSLESATTRQPVWFVDTPLLYSREDLGHPEAHDPFASLFYEDYVMDAVNDAKSWMSLRDWYNERNIPWRRGWLLSGPQGTGKSELVKAVAETLRIPLYVYHLSTMSNQEFMNSWSIMNCPCVVVFEDFDSVFIGRESQTEHKSLSFDCVLNQISGVQSRSGVFLIITTNHPEKLDPALGCVPSAGDEFRISSRPGRIDISLHLGLMSNRNKRRLADKTLKDWPDLKEKALSIPGEFTPAQFEELCVQMALRHIQIKGVKNIIEGSAPALTPSTQDL